MKQFKIWKHKNKPNSNPDDGKKQISEQKLMKWKQANKKQYKGSMK